MKFAILGADAATLAIARAADARTDVEIVAIADLEGAYEPELLAQQRPLTRSAKPLPSWESLLDGQVCDGVIVARPLNEDRIDDPLRKLVQAGVPVLIPHPLVSSMLLLYELDMIRRENRAIVLPALFDRTHPLMAKLAEVIAQGEASPIGSLEQITFERPLAERSKRNVQTHFARDVDLLRKLCGQLTQIGAMGTTGEELAYGNLSVQLTGPSGRLARWSVAPQGAADRPARLTLVGSRGKIEVDIPPTGSEWTESLNGQARNTVTGPAAADVALDRFAAAIRGELTEPDLLDAARALELTETIARSLRRRRTIDLHFEEHSEQNTFKSKMAASGCLLLMFGLAVLLFVAVADQAKMPLVEHWPKVLAVLFGGFLLLQLLLLVFRKRSE